MATYSCVSTSHCGVQCDIVCLNERGARYRDGKPVIHETSVTSFLPCLVTFGELYPDMLFMVWFLPCFVSVQDFVLFKVLLYLFFGTVPSLQCF